LFNVEYLQVEQDQQIVWHVFDDNVTLSGKWIEVNITIPVEHGGKDVSKPFVMKIFATR
jgi:hypothetical protein